MSYRHGAIEAGGNLSHAAAATDWSATPAWSDSLQVAWDARARVLPPMSWKIDREWDDLGFGCTGERYPSSVLFANFALPDEEPGARRLWEHYGTVTAIPTFSSPLARTSPLSVKSSTCTTRDGRARCPSASDTLTTTSSP